LSTEASLQWFSTLKSEWLLVFDNADHVPDMITKFLPPGNQGNILITSRNPNMQQISHSSAEICAMEKESAISLLLSLDSSNIDLRTTAEKIVAELCFLPLAVDQAGAAIASGLCHIGEFLGMYHQHHQRFLDDSTFKGASDYGHAVYGTWDVSFTEIQARAAELANSVEAQAAATAIFILQMFSFLHFEGITEEIFHQAAEASSMTTSNSDIALNDVQLPAYSDLTDRVLQLDINGAWDPISFREGIHVLQSFSLIKKNKVGNVYSIHPLVHSWSRDRMTKQNSEILACCASKLLSQSIKFRFLRQDYAFRQTLIPHIKANHQYAIKAGIRNPYDGDEGTNFSLVYFESGYWKEAEELQAQVLEMRKSQLGVEHPHTLTSIASLAGTFHHQGRWKEAEELQVQVLEMRKRVLGAGHPDTLTSIAHSA
jgi:Tetratricopeptide repeat